LALQRGDGKKIARKIVNANRFELIPRDVLSLCRERDVQTVRLRFCSLLGQWQSLVLPVRFLSEQSFAEGIVGPHSVLASALLPTQELTPRSPIHAEGAAHMHHLSEPQITEELRLLPSPSSAVLSRNRSFNVTNADTLDAASLELTCSIIDADTLQCHQLDSRGIATRLSEVFLSSNRVDQVLLSATLSVQIAKSAATTANPSQATEQPSYPSIEQLNSLVEQLCSTAISPVAISIYDTSQGLIQIQFEFLSVVHLCDQILLAQSLCRKWVASHTDGFSVAFGDTLNLQLALLRDGTSLFSASAATVHSLVNQIRNGVLSHIPSLVGLWSGAPHGLHPLHLNRPIHELISATQGPHVDYQNSSLTSLHCCAMDCVPSGVNPYVAISSVLLAAADGLDQANSDVDSTQLLVDDSISVAARVDALEHQPDYLLAAESFSEQFLKAWCQTVLGPENP
jgi:glutamine synthetase